MFLCALCCSWKQSEAKLRTRGTEKILHVGFQGVKLKSFVNIPLNVEINQLDSMELCSLDVNKLWSTAFFHMTHELRML